MSRAAASASPDSPAGSRDGLARPRMEGLVRQRVLGVLRHTVDRHPLTLVMAPAGSGKTTTLAQFAERFEGPHAWCQAVDVRPAPEELLEHLRRALTTHLPDLADKHWDTVGDAVMALRANGSPPATLLVIDDLHELRGTAAEPLLEELVRGMPRWLRIAAATRREPGIDLSELRLSEGLGEIQGDVLRWRPREVEYLFRHHYHMPLQPHEATQLTNRTEGWVAGLQFFRLASQNLPKAERSALVEDLLTQPGAIHDYLAQHVLGELPDDLRTFLLDTCVLGVLDPPSCDQLRHEKNSSQYLAELQERHLFLVPREDGHGHRYHEVLRGHLEVSLLERDGVPGVRSRFHRAARTHEGSGHLTDALYAYCRANAWAEVSRVLENKGASVAATAPPTMLTALPSQLIASDPWLQLAHARVLTRDGSLGAAIEVYRAAEAAFGSLPGARACAAERTRLQPWVNPRKEPGDTLTDRLRRAVAGDPQQQVAPSDDGSAAGLLTASLCALLAGSVRQARELARLAQEQPGAEVMTISVARALEQVTRFAGGAGVDVPVLLWSGRTLDQLGATWGARLVRLIATCASADGLDEARSMYRQTDADVDPWGRAVAGLVTGIACFIHGAEHEAVLQETIPLFGELGAGTLQAWAAAFAALTRDGGEAANDPSRVEVAQATARRYAVPGAAAISQLALSRIQHEHGEALTRAQRSAAELGLALPGSMGGQLESTSPAPVQITCFGGLSLHVRGQEVCISSLRPQARAVLAMLCLQTGSAVHRETLMGALWPEADPTAASRRLQVLISGIRNALSECDDEALQVHREGASYILEPPAAYHLDIEAFEEAISAARQAERDGDRSAQRRLLQEAMDSYSGQLLPEFGPAEWVVRQRDAFRRKFAHTALAVAEGHLEEHASAAALEAAQACLEVDQLNAPMWAVLIDTHRRMGGTAAAEQAKADRDAVFAGLSIE